MNSKPVMIVGKTALTVVVAGALVVVNAAANRLLAHNTSSLADDVAESLERTKSRRKAEPDEDDNEWDAA